MEKIHWQKKSVIKEGEALHLLKSLTKKENAPLIEKELTIGYNAGQFFIRLPRVFSEYLQLDENKARKKEYKFKIILDTRENNPEDKIVKGIFELEK